MAGSRALGVPPRRCRRVRPVAEQPPIEIRRSARRRRTVSARREADRIVILMPTGLSASAEQAWVARMFTKLDRQAARARTSGAGGRGAGSRRGADRGAGSDAALMERARRLSAAYLGGQARPVSVTWVNNQLRRWGSCTPSRGTIRLTERLQSMPDEVIDAVLLHELAHLLEPNHSARFWALLASYPKLEWARGYLAGVERAAGLDLDGPSTL